MRLYCLGCEVLARELYFCAARSPHIVDIELVRQGLHDTPSDLRHKLQEEIDLCAGQGYDAVVLAFGLCGKATEGLRAGDIPLVIPRVHDCITLFLGSRERYQQEFEKHPGTYWFANDYVERGKRVGSALTMGSVGPNSDTNALYAQYVAKYGKDNADYLMEVLGEWSKHYTRAAFVDMAVGDASCAERKAREIADEHKWTFECIAGDLVLLRRLLDGDWKNDYLILHPGEEVATSYDELVICRALKGQPVS